MPPTMKPFLLQPHAGSSPALPTYLEPESASPPPAPLTHDDQLQRQQQQRRRAPAHQPSITASPPRASKQSRPATSALSSASPRLLAASENFQPVPISDAEYVRLTYAWFEKCGVRGDGWKAGQEWTRERSKASKAVWEMPQPVRKQNMGASASPHASRLPSEEQPETRTSLLPNGASRSASHPSSRRPSSSSLRLGWVDDGTDRSTSPLPAESTSIASGSRSHLAAHGTDAVERLQDRDADQDGEGSIREDEGEARRARRVDRYGFFATDEDEESSNSRCRSTVLPTSALQAMPSRRLLGRPGGATKREKGLGRFAKRRGGSKKSSSEPPSSAEPFSPALSELSMEAKRQTEKEQELRKVAGVRKKKENALRTKEDSRVGKWKNMLVATEPALDAGPEALGRVTRLGRHTDEGLADEDDVDEGKEYELAPGRKVAKKLRGRIYKGVPDRWRSAVWWALIRGAHREEAKWEKSHPSMRKDELVGIGRPGAEVKVPILSEALLGDHTVGAAAIMAATDERASAVAPANPQPPSVDIHHITPEAAERRFPQLIHLSSSHDVQIDLDVPRTISGHVLFHTRYGQGQRHLFHVLHAFSLLCDRCAYCQGMGPIAATLLQYLSPGRAYAFLVAMHDCRRWNLHKTFSPGFPGLVENFYVQKQLLLWTMPKVAEQLDRHGISLSSFATRWYITLFSNVVPFQTQLRLWDAFLLEGEDVLVIFSLAILWSLRSVLGDAESTFEIALGTLSGEFVPKDDEALMRWTSNMMAKDEVRRRMHRARYEWADMLAKGEADGALL